MNHLNFLYHPISFQTPLFSTEYILKALGSLEPTPKAATLKSLSTYFLQLPRKQRVREVPPKDICSSK